MSGPESRGIVEARRAAMLVIPEDLSGGEIRWDLLASSFDEPLSDSDKSDCSLSGILPTSSSAAADPGLYSTLLNGMLKVAFVPASNLESRRMVPCIKSTRFLDMVKPRPVPPNRLAVLESAWLNGLNSRFFTSSSIPMPLSSIQNSMVVVSVVSLIICTLILTCPSEVNLMLFVSKLVRI